MKFALSDAEVKDIHANIESVPAKQLALIHKTVVNAYLISGLLAHERRSKGGSFFGEMGKDEIHWWVFKKEKNLEMFRAETEALLHSVKRLKDHTASLKDSFMIRSYGDLVTTLDRFVLIHEQEIDDIHRYISNLAKKDELAPCILFTYRVWGTTNQHDRISVKNCLGTVYVEDPLESLETVLGLTITSKSTAYWILQNIKDNSELNEKDFIEYIKSEEGAEKWLRATSRKVLDQVFTYFDRLLQSLRNILIEISEYYSVDNLITNREFWNKAIIKAVEHPLEDQLWDFKQTLSMWHSKGDIKLQHEVDFCENMAAFANANGGVMVIGVSNKIPRKFIGVKDSESRIKHLNDVITKRCIYRGQFNQIIDVMINDKICILVIIAQTKGVVGVLDEKNKYSYPKRQGTGLTRLDRAKIEDLKTSVLKDNYNFVAEIDKITNGRFISFSYK